MLKKLGPNMDRILKFTSVMTGLPQGDMLDLGVSLVFWE